eukprot:2608604-Amphidinium_carterae.1
MLSTLPCQGCILEEVGAKMASTAAQDYTGQRLVCIEVGTYYNLSRADAIEHALAPKPPKFKRHSSNVPDVRARCFSLRDLPRSVPCVSSLGA